MAAIAISEFELDWGGLRDSLIRHFRRRGAADPEEIAQEAIVRVLANLQAGVEVRSLQSYTYRVGVNVWREQRRLAGKFGPLEMDVVAEEIEPLPEWPPKPALPSLSSADLDLLRAYFPPEHGAQIGARAALALTLGLTANALRLRIWKIRSRLSGLSR